MAACAAPPATQDDTRSAETDARSGAEVLTDVWVERDGDASLVTLVGLEEPVYTAFLHEDPSALVLDIAGTEVSGPGDPQAVYDGLVEQVSVSTFEGGADGAMTRVEVTLSGETQYEVIPHDAGLVLRLSAVTPAEDDSLASEDAAPGEEGDPWADPGLETVSAEEPEPGMEPVAEMAPPQPATTLNGVDVSATEAGLLVHLAADGVIGATEAFTLADPERLVLDLPGLVSGVAKGTMSVDGEMVDRVRVGSHADKVRVVFDGGDASGVFDGRRLVPAANGLFLTLGSGDDLDGALAVALAESNGPAPMAEVETEVADSEVEPMADESIAVEETDGELEMVADATSVEEASVVEVSETAPELGATVVATVHGIHFDSQAERDRIVVLSEGLVEYEALFPDSESMVLSISGASIPREAEGRITPTPGGPVSLITAFQQPEVSTPEVRIVVKRAPELEPEISRRGEILFIDFPRTGAVAAAPPAFPGTTQVLATGSPQPAPGVTPVAADTAALAVEESMPSEVGASESGTAVVTITGEDGTEVVAVTPEEYGELASEPAGMDGMEGAEIAALPEFSEPASIDPAGGLEGPTLPTTYEPMGAAAPAALEPPAAVDMLEEGGLIDGKEYEGRRISLDFKDVEVADVLRIVAEVSDLNIVAGEEVTGKVTIRLVDVPWDQALDVILLTKGLGFVRVGNVLRIAPADILAQEEEIRLQERRNKEKLEDLVVKLHPVNYASVEDVKDLVQRLLSSRGTVNIDKRTNTVILKDIASVIDEASALINAIDTQTPQVMIEAKIVEAALDFSRELGTVWSIGTNPLQDGFGGSDDPRRDLGGEDFLFHDQNNVIFSNPITSLATGLVNMNAFILDEQIDLGVSLAAAESSGDGKVISSPRVVTLDNREAEIEQGVSIPFQTFENGDAKLEFIDAVLRLKVTPHITADKSIIMALEVERNAPDDSVQTPTGSPAIAKNEARTETLVKDGQTLVIGGIYTVVKSTRESRVPYLASIPILGKAFKAKEVTDQRKELLIFVTPRVVVAPSA
ncbi:MAG: type IV pilus secretin PilQ [Myxococcota bacterium]